MKYSVKPLRAAGLEARWTRTQHGAPVMVVRHPQAQSEHQRRTWWMVDNGMWQAMAKIGILEAFDRHTMLGNIFSIPI